MKVLFKIRNVVIVMALIFGLYANVQAQNCTITASMIKLCRGNTVKFSIPDPETSYGSITWDFGNGTTSTQKKSAIFNNYDTFGVFMVRVKEFDSPNNTGTPKCTDSLQITVYDNPKADFSLPILDTQCFKGNFFCFGNKSKPGVFNAAPIVQSYWNFGDGDSSTVYAPCHNYKTSGTYTIILQIKDANGCVDTSVKYSSIVVLPHLDPLFSTTFKVNCPTTTVTFTNKSDTNKKCIVAYYWNFGDGSFDSSQTNWTNFKHIYRKDGAFNPTLYLKDCHGCIDSFRLPSGARNIYYYFDITRNPLKGDICYGDKRAVSFSQTPRPLAQHWLWTFHDPYCPPPLNVDDKNWATSHVFGGPGVFEIELHIWEPNCERDTIMCFFTAIKGPQAMIKLPPPPAFPLNKCLRGKPVNILDFAWINSSCLFPMVGAPPAKPTNITYVTMKDTAKFVSGTRTYYCNAPVVLIDTQFKKSLCPGFPPSIVKINYHLDTSALKKENIYDSVKISASKIWNKGQALPPMLPKGQHYYYAPTGFPCFDQTMNENEIYKYNCQAPDLVRFTNNSIKYRMRYAIDDDPTKYYSSGADYVAGPDKAGKALQQYDRCFNKSYHWGSDSMDYTWDFGEGDACTSTAKKPSILCQYSKEIQPYHLYRKGGCWTATLYVYDSVTNCRDKATVQIFLEKPLASYELKVTDTLAAQSFTLKWNTVKHKYDTTWKYWRNVYDTVSKVPLVVKTSKQHFLFNRLDFRHQTQYTYLGKTGVRVNGVECASMAYDQTLDYAPTHPVCGRQTFWVLFDSATDCSSLCNDSVLIDYDSSGKAKYFHTRVANCNWIDEMTWNMGYQQKYHYMKGGCYTIAFIIQTGDCFDTFFYHNYKWMADESPYLFMMDPDSFNLNTHLYSAHVHEGSDTRQKYGLQLCAPWQPILTPQDQNQEGITKFDVTINKSFGAPWSEPTIFMEDSIDRHLDTLYYLCQPDSTITYLDPKTGKYVTVQNPDWCVWYPQLGASCYLPVEASSPLATYLANGYKILKQIYTLNLHDTLFMHDTLGRNMFQPGIYDVNVLEYNALGCAVLSQDQYIVGYYTDFYIDNPVICFKNGPSKVSFASFIRYFKLPDPYQPWLPEYDTLDFWKDPIGVRLSRGGPVGPGSGPTGPPVPPGRLERYDWDLDGDSIFETIPKLGNDTVTFTYTKPGNYTIRMRTIDSLGCIQVLERRGGVQVIGVVAAFDTAGGVGICAPQTVKFVDKSIPLNTWKKRYNKITGQIIDSMRVDSIVYWKWDFGDTLGQSNISYLRNPIHTYLKNGTYKVRLIVRMKTGCTDTVNTSYNYISMLGPKPHIRIVGDSTGCPVFTLQVKDSSSDVHQWEFFLGDTTTATFKIRKSDSIFSLDYRTPGTYWMYVLTMDSVWMANLKTYVQCVMKYGDPANPNDPHFKVVVYEPSKSSVSGTTLMCSGQTATFNDHADNHFDSIVWNLADTNLVTPRGQAVNHIYNLPGGTYDTTYHVVMLAKGAKCGDGPKDAYIRVKTTKALFDTINVDMDKYQFINYSKVNHLGADLYRWTIDGFDSITQSNLHYNSTPEDDTATFFKYKFGNAKGIFKVCLYTWIDTLNCLDSFCKDVKNSYEVELAMPNVFTPGDKNGVNDLFEPTNIDKPNSPLGVEKFDLRVYNRWGEMVFHSKDINNKWDGSTMGKGKRLEPAGTYYWMLNYQLRGEGNKTRSGTVTLIR